MPCMFRPRAQARTSRWSIGPFAPPTFSDVGAMGEFAGELAKLNAEVVDPVYLALGNITRRTCSRPGLHLHRR